MRETSWRTSRTPTSLEWGQPGTILRITISYSITLWMETYPVSLRKMVSFFYKFSNFGYKIWVLKIIDAVFNWVSNIAS
jgi:hypothetical protein